MLGRDILQVLSESINSNTRNSFREDIAGDIDTFVQGLNNSRGIDIDRERNNGNVTRRSILTGKNTYSLSPFLLLVLLLLTSLIPSIKFRHKLLMRGLASTPLCSFDLAFSLVLQGALGSMARLVRLVRSLRCGTVVMLHRRGRRHIGTGGALESKRERCQIVELTANFNSQEDNKSAQTSKALSERE
jgi:hypothetical protein